jgi:hypothetical protein
MRNWDIVESNVVYNLGSTTITIGDTNRVAVGMYISCGRAFPSNTRITAIISSTQVTVSNAALASSASDQITFYLSGINNGAFYDASNLIRANKAYLQDEIGEYIYDNYILPPTDKQKCKRDLGYLVDAITYHLKFGGNRKVVEFARSYYTNAGYPYGEELTYINRSAEETAAAIDAWENLGLLMIAAMRNQLTAGAYTTISPVIDNTILTDPISPVCQEVASSINTMIDIVKEIIASGAGSVEITEVNQNRTGYWSNTETYSNYNLIDDPLLLSQECNDVASSLNSLYLNVKDILDEKTVTRSLPDYVDGENKIFDLYWENGDEVITDEDEDLFLTINAVLQRPKYTEDYPRFDAYYIKRDVIPNQLIFDVAPIWDQDFSAKSIGEPTAVEKVVGIGVGNYKRLTIDYNLVNGSRSGPFLILDVKDLTVQNIEEPDFLYVFLDGVLQREGYSYTISGPNIFFNVPILEEMKIDMRYLYGRDIGQVLNIYDFNPDSYYAKSRVSLQVTSGLSQFINYGWMGDKIGSGIHAYQMNGNNTYNMIGEISNIYVNGNTVEFDVFGNKYQIDNTKNIIFAVKGFYSFNTSISISNSVVVFEKDEDNRLLLSDLNQIWSGTILGKTYKKPFVFLSNNDLIRIDGEDTFRKIKKLPGTTVSKENRNNQQVSNSLYGTVDVETYNGITRGEGLSVVAKIQNGKVISLEWNQRSYDPLTQPTAYQYYIPPVLNFISLDGNGGGAKANVLVSKGQVISVDLIDGGSGYTKAPKVVVSRGYDLLTERDIGVSLINVGVNSFVDLQSLTIVSIVDALGNQVSGVNSFTSIFFDSPISSDRVITAIVQLVRNTGDNLSREHIEFLDTVEPALDEVKIVTVSEEPTILIAQIQDIISNTTISTNHQITTTFENLIPNDALSNINYYATGAYLNVDLGISDNIVYVADTSKFKTNGYLLIGDEIVRYYRKLTDRFLKVQRGQSNTIAKSWTAGTFLRQIPDPISTVFGGVSAVESQSQVVTVKGGSSVEGIQERKTQFQIITPSSSVTTTSICIVAELQPEISIQSISSIFIDDRYRIIQTGSVNIISGSDLISNIKSDIFIQVQNIFTEASQILINQTEVLIIPPPTGAVDGYEEVSLLSDPLFTRLNGFVDLIDVSGQYFVSRRSQSDISIRNRIFGSDIGYIGTYEKTNVGHRISHFSGIFDDGYARVSGISIQELDTYYPSLTLQDFSDRANSSYTLSGDYFNLLPPSIQNPVTISQFSGTISSTISVQKTTYFPSSGYIFTGNGGVVQYTGKTSTTLTGCSVVRGSNILNVGTEIVPYQLT